MGRGMKGGAKPWLRTLSWLAFASPLLLASACGDSFEGTTRCEGDASLPCNEDPWACATGQNCWVDMAGAFACFNVGSGALGDACQPVTDGSTCQQDMGCVQLADEPQGVCRAFCDPSDPCKVCPDGLNCVPVGFPSNGQTMNVCLP